MEINPVLTTPPTPTAAAARDVVEKWASPALVNHCLRSYIWAVLRAEDLGVDYDLELLYVAAMLHDLGATTQFDAASVPFEDAGGSVAWAFAAGAGWSTKRRDLLREVIQQHAWPTVDPADIEAYLLEAATSLDVAGSGHEHWDHGLLVEVSARYPRLNFTKEFGGAMRHQADAKPDSHAARFTTAHGVERGEEFWNSLLE